jgi:hypothetical protein
MGVERIVLEHHGNIAILGRQIVDALIADEEIAPGGLVLGQEQDAVGGGFDPAQALIGILDDVRLWHRILTPDEIATQFLRSIDGTEAGLGAWWPLDEADGDEILDGGPVGWTGTLGGGGENDKPTRIESTVPLDATFGIHARYLMTAVATDTVPPHIVDNTLPAHATSSTEILHEFSLTFSEDMNHGTVNNPDHYELRHAGSDGLMGTDDDWVYTLVSDGYLTGTEATLRIVDGPLQPGLHRFTAGSGLTDRAGNPLDPTHSREFTIERLMDFFQFETPGNHTRETATSLSLVPPGGFDGSFDLGRELGLASNPFQVELTDLTGNAPVDATFHDRVRIRNLTGGDTLRNATVLYDVHAPGLGPIGPGESRPRQFEYRLPEGPRGVGEIEITITTDTHNAIFEFNPDGTATLNNLASTRLTTTLAPYPDLIVQNVIGPPSATPGQNVEISYCPAPRSAKMQVPMPPAEPSAATAISHSPSR